MPIDLQVAFAEIVRSLVPGGGHRAAHEPTEDRCVVLELCEYTAPLHEVGVVVAHLVAQAHRVAQGVLITAAGVHVVVAAKQVVHLGIVVAAVVAQVQSAGEFELVVHAVGGRGEQPIPHVVVHKAAEDRRRLPREVIVEGGRREDPGVPRVLVVDVLEVDLAIGGAQRCAVGEPCAATVPDAHVSHVAYVELVAHLPEVAQGELRLVEVVDPFTEGLALHVGTVPAVIEIKAFKRTPMLVVLAAIVLRARGRSAMVSGEARVVGAHVQFERALRMALWRAEPAQTEQVLPQSLLHLGEPEPALRPSVIDPSIALLERACQRDAPISFHSSAVEPNGGAQVVVIGDLLLDDEAALLVDPLGEDVDRAAHGGDRDLARAQSALHLNAAGGRIQPEPVAPIHSTVLHVVHRHAVEHHRHVALAEAAQRDAGISIAAAVGGGVNPRRTVQQHRDIARGQLFLDLAWLDGGEGHGRLPLHGNVRHHLHLGEGDAL